MQLNRKKVLSSRKLMSSSRKLFAFQPKNRCQPSKKCVNRPKERDANKMKKDLNPIPYGGGGLLKPPPYGFFYL